LADDHETASMARVSSWMAAQGLRVGVLSLQGEGPLAGPLRRAGVEVRWIELPIRHPVQVVSQARRHLLDFRPDLVHTWGDSANRLGRLAAWVTRVPRLIASHHTLPTRVSWAARMVDRLLARHSDAIVVNSRTVLEGLDQAAAAADTRLSLIPEGVPRRTRMTAAERVGVRKRLGVPPEAKLIGTVGPIVPASRLKDAIWAVDLLRGFYEHVYLLVIGQGSGEWRLRRYTEQVDAGPRTRFLGQPADWIELLGAVDCLCQPGPLDTPSVGVLEAMAAAVPIVATDIAGHRELIERERTGLLVGVGQRGAISRQVHRVLEDRALAERLGFAAQEFVRRRHSLEDMLSHYLQLYCGPVSVVPGRQDPAHAAPARAAVEPRNRAHRAP
jgi:glycosyltransferase involved in cell wall biosynthesis